MIVRIILNKHTSTAVIITCMLLLLPDFAVQHGSPATVALACSRYSDSGEWRKMERGGKKQKKRKRESLGLKWSIIEPVWIRQTQSKGLTNTNQRLTTNGLNQLASTSPMHMRTAISPRQWQPNLEQLLRPYWIYWHAYYRKCWSAMRFPADSSHNSFVELALLLLMGRSWTVVVKVDNNLASDV